MIVYRVVQKSTGKNYIGATKARLEVRRASHEYQAASLVGQAIKQYGPEDFEWSILWRGALEEAAEKEREFIQQFNSLVPNGFNRNRGWLYRRYRRHSKPTEVRRSYRLTVHAVELIDLMAKKEGVTEDAIVEMAIRQMAEKYGVLPA